MKFLEPERFAFTNTALKIIFAIKLFVCESGRFRVKNKLIREYSSPGFVHSKRRSGWVPPARGRGDPLGDIHICAGAWYASVLQQNPRSPPSPEK